MDAACVRIKNGARLDPILTRNTGRPDLPIGSYLLEEDRQSPAHPIRRSVLVHDKYSCQKNLWNYKQWNPSDPRHLEYTIKSTMLRAVKIRRIIILRFALFVMMIYIAERNSH